MLFCKFLDCSIEKTSFYISGEQLGSQCCKRTNSRTSQLHILNFGSIVPALRMRRHLQPSMAVWVKEALLWWWGQGREPKIRQKIWKIGEVITLFTLYLILSPSFQVLWPKHKLELSSSSAHFSMGNQRGNCICPEIPSLNSDVPVEETKKKHRYSKT